MRAALIGGTGMEKVEGFEAETGGPIVQGRLLGQPIGLLPRHGDGHVVPPHRIDHVKHVSLLKEGGYDGVFATAAVGSLREDWPPGTLALCSDFIDLMRSITTLYRDKPVHTDFSEPFSTVLRDALIETASEIAVVLHPEAVYASAPGPRFETPAEIRMMRLLGADVVGMTVGPEAILCREAGLPYAAIAIVTNFGTGLTDQKLAHGEVETVVAEAQGIVVRLIAGAIAKLSA